MLSTWALLAFNLLLCSAGVVRNDITKAFIELTELGYEDTCHDTAEAEWSFVNTPSEKTLAIWEEKLLGYANFKKEQKDEVRNVSKINLSDPSLKYKYEVIEKAGDALTDDEDFGTFAHFVGTVELLKAAPTNSGNHTYKDVEHVLSHNNDIETKQAIWTTWNEGLTSLVQNFSTHLNTLKDAAKANDAKNVAEYWELLAGYTNGYEKIKYEWSRIEDLHKKILNFAITTLSQKYGVNITETVPAYLLGSLEGNDWCAVSTDITPYPGVMYDIRKNLWKKNLVGQGLYKIASNMGVTLLNQVPQADFWDKSEFDRQCPAKLINFCRDGIMRVSTCFEPTLSNFLAAHKNVGKILFNQMSVETTPVLNTANRYSGLEEAVAEMFGILSASPAWLNHTRLINDSIDNDQRQIVSLTITALNVLPRLAYYLSADMWRIDAIETEVKEPADLVLSWWKHRQEYEGITPNGTYLPTFLNDDHIVRNKPYLSKFVGTLLAFQLYENLLDNTEVRYERIVGKQVNANFIKMIQQGAADGWMGILEKYLDIDDISADSLMSFFTPLEDFIDELDEDFRYIPIAAEKTELEEIEKKVIEEMNAPVTTTTTTVPTITTIVTRRRMTNTTPPPKLDIAKTEKNSTSTSGNSLEAKSSVHVQDDQPEGSSTTKSGVSTKVPFEPSLTNNMEEEQNKPKINTSKAVWAVGAVLVATIVICVIAIFGRQRCRKTPKNRRYV